MPRPLLAPLTAGTLAVAALLVGDLTRDPPAVPGPAAAALPPDQRPAPPAPPSATVAEPAPGPAQPLATAPPAVEPPRIVAPPQPSRALGLPFARGRLVHGVKLPAWGRDHLTWDPILHRSPSRSWRRWGTDRLVNTLLAGLAQVRSERPDAPQVLIGDLSRPRGGIFDRRYGGLGHASHQNGLDVDVFYPRVDRRLVAPERPSDVDRELAQLLVDRFVALGAVKVFVGPRLDLTGPRDVVVPLVHHDDHLHVRIR